MPQLLGDERHERAHQPQLRVECCEQVLPGYDRAFAIGTLQIGFDPLNVPVAKISPEKLVHTLGCFVKTIVGQGVIYKRDGVRKPCEQPSIDKWNVAVESIRRRGTDFR